MTRRTSSRRAREAEMKVVEDPYFERRNGGRRVHEIPHIAELPSHGAEG